MFQHSSDKSTRSILYVILAILVSARLGIATHAELLVRLIAPLVGGICCCIWLKRPYEYIAVLGLVGILIGLLRSGSFLPLGSSDLLLFSVTMCLVGAGLQFIRWHY